MKLTKKQFREQFKQLISWQDIAGRIEYFIYHDTIHGYKIYRLLNKLVLEDDQQYFLS